MRIILLFLLMFSLNLFSQNEIVMFSIGISYQNDIEKKVQIYFEKHDTKYDIIFICPEQKIYVIRIKTPFIDMNTLFTYLHRKFKNTQFLYKEEKDFNPNCLKEYKKLLQ